MRLGQTSFIHFTAKVIATISGFITTVIFARILGAEVLGTYSLALGVTAWITLPTILGIGGAINKRLSEGTDVGEYMAAGAIIMGVMLIFVILVVIVGDSYLTRYIGSSVTEFIIIIVFLSTVQSYIDAVLQGHHQVHIAGILAPIGAISRSSLQIAAILLGSGIAGLLLTHALGTVVPIILGFIVAPIAIRIPKRTHIKSLISFAQFSWLNQMRSRTFNKLDIIALGFFVSSNLIGIYSISWNIAAFLGIFASSLSATLFPEISELSAQNNHKDIETLIQKSMAYAGLVHIPGFVGAIIIGRRILRIYGAEFTSGYTILLILIFAYLVHSYNKQMLTALEGLDHPKLAFQSNLALIISNILLNISLIYFFGWVGAAVATTLSVCISFLLGYWYLNKIINITIPIHMIGKELIAAGIMGSTVQLLLHIQNIKLVALNNITVVLLVISLGAGTYFTTLGIISSEFRKIISDNISIY